MVSLQNFQFLYTEWHKNHLTFKFRAERVYQGPWFQRNWLSLNSVKTDSVSLSEILLHPPEYRKPFNPTIDLFVTDMIFIFISMYVHVLSKKWQRFHLYLYSVCWNISIVLLFGLVDPYKYYITNILPSVIQEMYW